VTEKNILISYLRIQRVNQRHTTQKLLRTMVKQAQTVTNFSAFHNDQLGVFEEYVTLIILV
jgi:hypothetical protein